MYYNKKQVQEYFQEQLQIIETDQEKHRLIGTPEELARQFLDDHDVLGIFWTTHEDDIVMHGKSFVQIEPDLYTDDRYALDVLVSVKEGKTVGDVVREREEKQNIAREAIEGNNPQNLINLFKK